MGLRNLSFPVVTVDTPGGSFAVRGLTTDMVLGLYHRHRGQLSGLFDSVVARQKEQLPQDVPTIIASAMQSAPDIAAELIALASGSQPDGTAEWEADLEMARALSFPIQVDALEKVFGQTFTEAMPVGKFLAVVIKLAGDATAVLPNQKG